MRNLILILFLVLSSVVHSRCTMWTIKGNVPLAATSSHSERSVVLCYVYPGERIMADTNGDWGQETTVIFKQDGKSGRVLKSELQAATDTNLFRFQYSEALFPFYTDTTVYETVYYNPTGWGELLAWMRYISEADTFNVPAWTKRAYDGDTAAMRILLLMTYGESMAAGQFRFNKWKLINHWSDSCLAELLLSSYSAEDGVSPSFFLNYTVNSPFVNDEAGLMNYYRVFYPLCYSLLLREQQSRAVLSEQEIGKFREQIRGRKRKKK